MRFQAEKAPKSVWRPGFAWTRLGAQHAPDPSAFRGVAPGEARGREGKGRAGKRREGNGTKED